VNKTLVSARNPQDFFSARRLVDKIWRRNLQGNLRVCRSPTFRGSRLAGWSHISFISYNGTPSHQQASLILARLAIFMRRVCIMLFIFVVFIIFFPHIEDLETRFEESLVDPSAGAFPDSLFHS